MAASASNIFSFCNVHKYIGLKPVGSYHFRQHFKPIGTFFAMACATTVYTNLDNVLLGFISGDTDVGYYHAAVRIKSILVSIVTSLGAALLPRISYYIEQGQLDEFRRIAQKATNFVVVVAAPLMVYFILLAREGVLLLSGSAYFGAVLPMQIVMPALLVVGLSNITGTQILVPTGRERIVLYSVAAGAAVDLLVNIALIPKMAAVGAAVATLAAEMIVLLIQCLALKNEVLSMFQSLHLGKLFVALACGATVSFGVKALCLDNFIVLMISSILFFGAYGGVLLLFKEPLVVDVLGQFLGAIRKKRTGT